ncbi:MAG: RNA polymerase factor sigma-54, partial [Firmicutes bacterium]|nr:RNA polymerase factor sigma-54 [Bacillota bacterium]
EVISVVQTFDPPGIGARDLSECLAIQLEQTGELTDEYRALIFDKLSELAENKISLISKEIGLKPSDVQAMADRIKRLEPRPGRQYDPDQTVKYVIPDVYVEKVGDEYVVTDNESSTPHLMISSYYSKLTADEKDSGELKDYLNERLNSAMWLIKSIDQRKSTIHKVASEIVNFQKEYFDKGERYLKPLTLRQIAERIGAHESTVSRSINGKYMQCAMGVLELKYFFTSGVMACDGQGISSSSIKSMIKEIVDGENPKRPYSDLKIAEMLGNEGVEISRRTVAKYREDLQIASSSKRRRY